MGLIVNKDSKANRVKSSRERVEFGLYSLEEATGLLLVLLLELLLTSNLVAKSKCKHLIHFLRLC